MLLPEQKALLQGLMNEAKNARDQAGRYTYKDVAPVGIAYALIAIDKHLEILALLVSAKLDAE